MTIAQIAHQPVSWILPDDSRVVRESIRPPDLRQPDFDECFDATTIFFDALRVDSKRAVLVAPPLLNLSNAISAMTITALPSGLDCAVRVVNFDRETLIWLDAPNGTLALRVSSDLGDPVFPLQADESARFAGKRVIFTLNKNNRPEWIGDWIRYYRDIHGANAVVLYDNDSTAYTLHELQHALQSISGIDAIALVPWPFKYGAQVFGNSRWDSDYCQIGAMQDARWRFLQHARSVLNVDVDELTISRDSIFELIEASAEGYLSFFGTWVVGLSNRDEQLQQRDRQQNFVRHRDFSHALRVKLTLKRHPKWRLPVPSYMNRSALKWGVIPSRCPESAQWTAHWITSMATAPAQMRRVSYRHFREISTGWKYDRSRREEFRSRTHRYDDALVRTLSKVDWDR